MPLQDTRPHVAEAAERWAAVKARLMLILLCLGWGITWPMMRIALTDIPPFSMRVGSLLLARAR